MSGLKSLVLTGNMEIADLSPLAGLTKLQSLEVPLGGENVGVDLSPLAGLADLLSLIHIFLESAGEVYFCCAGLSFWHSGGRKRPPPGEGRRSRDMFFSSWNPPFFKDHSAGGAHFCTAWKG